MIVRLSPPTLDMIAYSSAMVTWPPPLTPYTLREPIVWFGAPLLYKFTDDRVLTFLVFDIASGLIVIRATRGMDDGDGRMLALAPTILASYVFLMGQQNGWRQQIAFVIFLWSCSARTHHQRRAIVLFILSILAHNATALLAGYWYDIGRMKKRRYGPLITISGVALVALLFPYLGKSSSVTGLQTEYLYVIVAVAISSFILYARVGRLPLDTMDGVSNFVAFVPAIVVLGSTQFERMGMMFLVLILIDLVRHHRSLRVSSSAR